MDIQAEFVENDHAIWRSTVHTVPSSVDPSTVRTVPSSVECDCGLLRRQGTVRHSWAVQGRVVSVVYESVCIRDEA